MSSLHVAVLDEELPYPLTSGKRIRTYHLLARLARRHRITLMCHRNPDEAESAAAEDEFRRLGIETVVVDRVVPPKSGAGFYARLAGNLLSPLPYSVATHTSLALAVAVARLAADAPPDLWHCEWTPYAQVLRDGLGQGLGRARWVVMAHNVESLIWQRYAEAEANPLKRWYVRRQRYKFERFEHWAYTACTRAIAVSPEDAALMRQRFGVARPEVVENGVDVRFFRPQRDVERDPARLLFLGSLDWRPNLDALTLLLDTVWPRVRAEVPHATLAIVGRKPPDWLRRQAVSRPGVRLYADVPDVRPFLATCGLLVVPLRVGGGSRLKILEALATGTPVVSTRLGAEGLALTPGRDLTVTDTPEGLPAAIIRAVRYPEEARDQAENGRRVVVARYSWDRLAERLDTVWQAAANLPTPTAVASVP